MTPLTLQLSHHGPMLSAPKGTERFAFPTQVGLSSLSKAKYVIETRSLHDTVSSSVPT